jgi:hypothetical protein
MLYPLSYGGIWHIAFAAKDLQSVVVVGILPLAKTTSATMIIVDDNAPGARAMVTADSRRVTGTDIVLLRCGKKESRRSTMG